MFDTPAVAVARVGCRPLAAHHFHRPASGFDRQGLFLDVRFEGKSRRNGWRQTDLHPIGKTRRGLVILDIRLQDDTDGPTQTACAGPQG